jgi:hypothetical protein
MVEKEKRSKTRIKRLMLTLPLSYFGPIEEFVYLAKNDSVVYEIKEHFVKQSYRNRCIIYSANGLLKLSVPVVLKSREKTAMENIQISYAENWQKMHWKSIQSAYKNSPFFDYYEEILRPIFLEKFKYLKDLNIETHELIKQCLQIDCTIKFSSEFQPYFKNDLRQLIHFKKKSNLQLVRYIQVFEEKHGFHANLSILDLLFNEGPASIVYLNNVSIKESQIGLF